jgi:hypothetical protein
MDRIYFDITYNDYVWIYAETYKYINNKVTDRLVNIQARVERFPYVDLLR